jgi:hypothetical protein
LGIGVLGEYVVRIYDQVRARPQYIVREVVRHDTAPTDARESELAEELQEIRGLAEAARTASRFPELDERKPLSNLS